jgi:hypothetical protein
MSVDLLRRRESASSDNVVANADAKSTMGPLARCSGFILREIGLTGTGGVQTQAELPQIQNATWHEIEGALYGAKFLANFLAYAERSNSNGAAPGNKNPVRKYPRTLT